MTVPFTQQEVYAHLDQSVSKYVKNYIPVCFVNTEKNQINGFETDSETIHNYNMIFIHRFLRSEFQKFVKSQDIPMNYHYYKEFLHKFLKDRHSKMSKIISELPTHNNHYSN